VQGAVFRYDISQHFFYANNHTVKECIGFAYELPPGSIVGGPAWTAADRYDISALTGAGSASEAQMLLMFQTLLMERFGLTFHREIKEVPVYELVIGNGGLKLKENAAGPEKAANLVIQPTPNRAAMIPARNATMAEFVSTMQRLVMDRPVLDRTGLTGTYDFDLEWAVDGTRLPQTLGPVSERLASARAIAGADGKPDIFTAVQQLGLRFEGVNAPVDVLVIDTVEKPNTN
jgi:uncharacterized protein (TIGR03435 family)